MKKRIISLILVLATAFLTLTGCAFNYAKSDMSDYAEFSAADFKKLLGALQIEDADFSKDAATRELKVTDAIAKALLGITDSEDKKFEGKVENFDVLYYCYYATDDKGNIFFADKMAENTDASKLQSIQLGLTDLDKEGNELKKAIAEKLAGIADIKDYIYKTSNSAFVGEGDVLSISYVYEETVNGEKKTENNKIVFNEYIVANDKNNALHAALIGAPVGVLLPTATVTETTEANETIVKTYSNLKVEHIAVDKDSAAPEIKDGDRVFVSYTVKFDADKIKVDGKLPEGFKEGNVKTDGKYELTVKYEIADVKADPKGADDKVAEADKTFLGQLIGKTVGKKVDSITTEKAVVNGVEVGKATYSNITVNWVVNSDKANDGFTVEHTLFDDETSKDTVTKYATVYSNNETVELKNVKLTYHIFPLYFVDVADAEKITVKTLLEEFASVVGETEEHHEHEEAGENGEHVHPYVFDSLNKDKDGKEYKNAEKNKTLAELVDELVALQARIAEKQEKVDSTLKTLKEKQKKYGELTGDSATDKNNAETELKNAEKAYNAAKQDLDVTKDGVLNSDDTVKTAGVAHLVADILACKKDEATAEAALLADFRQYHYDILKEEYYDEISKAVASEILTFLKTKVTIKDDNLPKRAIKEAYKALINEYKYKFYTSKTEYDKYKGDFDEYLMKQVNKSDIDDAKDAVRDEAKETVKEIMLIYVLVDMVESQWTDADPDDFLVTKKEKKELKKYVRLYNNSYKDVFELYSQMGLDLHALDFDTEYNAMQFNKVMDFLLERKDEVKDEDGNLTKLELSFENISYTFKEPVTE